MTSELEREFDAFFEGSAEARAALTAAVERDAAIRQKLAEVATFLIEEGKAFTLDVVLPVARQVAWSAISKELSKHGHLEP